mgnify:CR=1 FL=1
MITETGKNLSILITTETGKDWETFGTWYSFFKNLPDAKVGITSARNTETPFQYYQWAKRVHIPVIRHDIFNEEDSFMSRLDAVGLALSQKIVEYPLLVVDPLIMAIDILDQKFLELLNSSYSIFGKDTWLLNGQNIPDMMHEYMLRDEPTKLEENLLSFEAKETEDITPLVSYKKGCGKWIDKLKGCPFSNVNGLMTEDMTLCEVRIAELWRKMCGLYSVVA